MPAHYRKRNHTVWPKPAWALIAVLVAIAYGPPVVRAVTFVDQISRLEHIYAFLLDYRNGQAPRRGSAWETELALDIIPVPEIDNRIGNKNEPVQAPPAIPRPRLRVFSGGGIFAGGSWIPPVTVNGYTANIWGVETGFVLAPGRWLAALRAVTVLGRVEGPISDSQTDDTFTFANNGLELIAGRQFDFGVLYAGAGIGHISPRLHIGADGSSVAAPLDYGSFFAGYTIKAGPLRLSVEQHQSASVLRHILLSISYVVF